MKKSMKRILCGVLSLGLCATVATESVLRWNAKGDSALGTTTANASFKNVTGMYDTSAMREANFNDSVLKSSDVAPVYETRTVLVTLSGDNLVERATDTSVESYLRSFSGEVAKSDISKEQANFLQSLKEMGIPYTLEHTYNAVLNGVAVELDTKYVSEIKKMKGVDSVVITTAYAYPEAAEGEGSGVVTNETQVRATGIYDSSEYTANYGDNGEGGTYTNYGTGMVVAVLDTGLDYTHDAFQTFQHELEAKDIAWSREEVASKMKEENLIAEQRSGSLDVSDVYVSAKVPFAYDYADDDADVYPSYSNHGTHVAGIIGGYDPSGYTDKDGNPINETFLGVVPDAQLMICKVFTDDLDDKDLGGAVSEDIVAALDDCVKMNVDVINMSLGSSCGFTTTDDGDDEGDMLNAVYEEIGKAGITLVCAASNDYSAGYGGVYGTNLKTNPDAGTVGSPSTYASAFSVASINGQKASYMIANDNTYVFFEEARDINSNPMEFVKQMTTEEAYKKYGKPTADGGYEFEYVVIPGVGEGKDYSSSTVNLLKAGRIALVKRGDSSFEEKVRLAKSMGAIGVIIYNNVAGSIRMNLGEIENPIPAVSTSMNAGNAMVSAAKKTGNVGKVVLKADYAAGPFMSEFSSWGPTPDLRMKPEITAHGGEITSAVPGGYGEQSGTSMASPNTAGFMAVVRSYLTQEHLKLITTDGSENPDKIDNVKLNDLAMQLTMSTAGIVYDQDGLPYSPRKQGAGVAKLENVVDGTSAYLYTDDDSTDYANASKDGRPKIELGDMLHEKNIEFTFYVNNFGTQELNFDLKATLMTETLSSDDLTVVEQAHLLNNGSTVKFYVDGNEVTSLKVEGNTAKKAVTVKITLGDKDKKYIEDCFENGMYVEGFVTLASKTAGQCDMNLPFMGFYGDWEQAPMLDYSAYEVADNAQDSSVLEEDKIKASVWATQPYNIYYNDKYVLPMGGYLYLLPEDADEMYVDEEHNAVSRYNDYYGEGDVNNYMTSTGIKAVYAGLLRNAREVRYTLTDEATGEVLIADTINRVAKAYAGGGSAVPANVKLEIYPEEWGFIANGKYRMDFEFIREDEEDMPEDSKNTFSFSFTVDYEAPILENARVRFENYKEGNKEKRRVHLDLDVYDNHYAQTLMLCYPKTKANGDVVVQLLTDYPTPVRNAVKNGITTVSIDITDIYEKYGNTLYLQIDDYALNTCLYQLDINQANANSIPDGGFSIVEDDKLTGGKLNLDKYEMYKPTVLFGENYKGDADSANLLWKSNNPKIAVVKNGEIVGVGAGTTKILVNNRKGEQKTIEVTVSDKQASSLSKIPAIEFGIIQTEADAWTKATGDVEVAAGKDLTLEILTDPWYHPMTDLKIRWESVNEQVATVTPSADGKSAVITTLKKGSAQIRATVQTKTADGGWKDSQYKVGVTLRVQEEFDVSNFTLNDYNGVGYNEADGILRIPTDKNIMYIGENAFEDNTTIKKIIIPSSVVEIRPRAFKNCTALEEVYFVETTTQDIADADVSMIYENAFEGCVNLKKVDFSNVKTVTIAQDCFSGCVNLTTVNGMPKIGTMHHRAFAGTALTSVDLSGLHMSGEQVFANCKNLVEITATSKFSAIGKEMFLGCSSLAGTVTLNTPKIGEGAFSGCTAIEKVVFTKEVQELDIGARAFENCGKAADGDFSIVFENGCSVRAIGEKAFIGSTLSSFDFSAVNGLEVLGENAFQSTKLTKITLTDNLVKDNGSGVLTYIRSTGIPFEGLTVKVATGSTKFSEENGTIYGDNQKTILYVNPSVTGAYTLKEGVTTIADYAFAASKISSLQLNADVTSIGVGAFKNSTLTAFDFNGNTNVTEIPAYAFAGSYLATFDLPATVTEIGESAFKGSDLHTFTLASASQLTDIGSYAFASCYTLTEIDLSALTLEGEQTRTMGEGVFYDCASLTSAKLPSVTDIGAYTFLGASKLATVDFGAKSTTTGDYTLSGTPVTSVTLPEKVESIGEAVFYECTELKSIVLPVDCVEVGAHAFDGCTSLTEVTGLGNVQKFGDSAFYRAALPALTLTAATDIGDMAFAQPDTAKDSVKFTSVTFGENVRSIGDFAFFNGGADRIDLPASVRTIGDGAFAASTKLQEITVEESAEATFFDEDGVLYRKAGTEGQYELVSYPTARRQQSSKGSYTVKEGTARIQAYAFAYLNEGMVEHVVLPYTLKSIGDSAFFVSNISEYTFESILAPTLEASYRAEVREAVGADEAVAAYKGYYYTNFQTYLYHFTKYGGQKSPLTIHYPCNGSGYTNHIYSMYFGVKNPSAAPMQEDNTRALLKIVAAMPEASEVKTWTTANKTKAEVEALAETMKTARSYYNNAVKNDGQKGYVTEETETKLLAVEKALRDVKKQFGITVYAQQLLLSEESTHRTQYAVGETFDMSGLVLLIEYDDYSTELADASDLKLVTTGELADYMETVEVEHRTTGIRVRIPITVTTVSSGEESVDGEDEEKDDGKATLLLIVGGVAILGGCVFAVCVGIKKKKLAKKRKASKAENAQEDAQIVDGVEEAPAAEPAEKAMEEATETPAIEAEISEAQAVAEEATATKGKKAKKAKKAKKEKKAKKPKKEKKQAIEQTESLIASEQPVESVAPVADEQSTVETQTESVELQCARAAIDKIVQEQQHKTTAWKQAKLGKKSKK